MNEHLLLLSYHVPCNCPFSLDSDANLSRSDFICSSNWNLFASSDLSTCKNRNVWSKTFVNAYLVCMQQKWILEKAYEGTCDIHVSPWGPGWPGWILHPFHLYTTVNLLKFIKWGLLQISPDCWQTHEDLGLYSICQRVQKGEVPQPNKHTDGQYQT